MNEASFSERLLNVLRPLADPESDTRHSRRPALAGKAAYATNGKVAARVRLKEGESASGEGWAEAEDAERIACAIDRLFDDALSPGVKLETDSLGLELMRDFGKRRACMLRDLPGSPGRGLMTEVYCPCCQERLYYSGRDEVLYNAYECDCDARDEEAGRLCIEASAAGSVAHFRAAPVCDILKMAAALGDPVRGAELCANVLVLRGERWDAAVAWAHPVDLVVLATMKERKGK